MKIDLISIGDHLQRNQSRQQPPRWRVIWYDNSNKSNQLQCALIYSHNTICISNRLLTPPSIIINTPKNIIISADGDDYVLGLLWLIGGKTIHSIIHPPLIAKRLISIHGDSSGGGGWVSAEIALGINVYASIELKVVECVELLLFVTGKSLLTFPGHQSTADRTFIILHVHLP